MALQPAWAGGASNKIFRKQATEPPWLFCSGKTETDSDKLITKTQEYNK